MADVSAITDGLQRHNLVRLTIERNHTDRIRRGSAFHASFCSDFAQRHLLAIHRPRLSMTSINAPTAITLVFLDFKIDRHRFFDRCASPAAHAERI